MESNHYKENNILGIGLGVQGLISPDGSEFTYGKILNCTGFSLEAFANTFSVPCKFIHDSECACNTELWKSPDIKDVTYISLNYHLGGAIIVDGQLLTGATGKSGTFEHMTLVPGGHDCYCGRQGCAECYCSVNSLLGDSDNLEEFFEKKSAGDTDCIEKWEDYLRHLSILINNLHMVLEHTVILGGHVAPYFTDEDFAKIRHYVAERSTFDDDTSYIIPGKCPGDTVAIGAVCHLSKNLSTAFILYNLRFIYKIQRSYHLILQLVTSLFYRHAFVSRWQVKQILFSEYFVFLLFFTFFSDYLLTFLLSCDIIISTKEKEDGPPIS